MFFINDDNELTGFLWDKDEEATISVDNLDQVLGGLCTTSVNDFRDRLDSSLSIYPNPTSDMLVVSRTNFLEGLNYQICDITGRAIKEGQFVENVHTISLRDFASGIYLLTIYLDGFSYSRLVVKV